MSGEDSGRTDDGVMRINWIFKKVRKVEIEMPPMKSSDLSRLRNVISKYESEYSSNPSLNSFARSYADDVYENENR